MESNNKQLSKKNMDQLADFFVRLFQGCDQENNIIISPLSALFMLALMSVGAKGNTLIQLEDAVGMSSEEFTDTVRYLGNSFNWCHSDTSTASAILINDNDQITLNGDFLYKAEKISLWLDKFEGPHCVEAMNEWINRLTCGMIKEVIDHVPENLTIALFNAIAFMCEWKEPYEEEDIYDEDFTSASGSVKEVKMLHSEEKSYYEDEDVVGVMKPYKGGRYDFVALLPNEEIGLSDYIRSLSGEKLSHILSGFDRYWKVETTIPAFIVDSEQALKKIFEEMGAIDVFDPEKANLSGMAELKDGNLYISDLKQKAYIKVDEWGTKAAAVTGTIFGCTPSINEIKEVRLDRPFMYLIVERGDRIPLFIGTVMDVKTD